jgi:hypothetical protein
MMSNDCIERVDTVFKIEMLSDLTRLIIHFIYKEQTDRNSSQATLFLRISDMYMLPGTGELASDTIRKNIEGETAIAQLIEGWETPRQAESN